MTPRVGIYTRLSKDPTGQQTATARQEADCRAYAKAKGWKVAEVYEDVDLSAFRRVKRPAYERMLADLAAKRIDGVLVWKLDRLLRRSAEFERCWDICEKAGATLASVNDGFDTSHATGRAMARIAVVFATLESETMSLRIRAERAEAAASGRRPPGGKRTFGHDETWSTLIESEAALVREAVERVLNGASLRSIVLEWESRGIRTPSGRTWKTQGLRSLLLSDRIAGQRRHHGELVADGTWPAIIDRETWQRVRAVLVDPDRRTLTEAEPNLLGGFVFCGGCGHSMRRGRYANGERRYQCPPKPEGCNARVINATALEAYVVGVVLGYVDSPAFARAFAGSETDDLALATAALDSARTKLDALVQRWTDDEITDEVFEKHRPALRERVRLAEARLAAVRPPAVLHLAGRGDELRAAWEVLTFAERRAVLEAVPCLAVTVGPARRGYNRFDPERVTVAPVSTST